MLQNFLDKTDIKIVSELQKNARVPISQIAKNARISKQACYYRIKRLEEELILKYKTKINSSKLGYSSFCIYINLMNFTLEEEEELIKKVTSTKTVRWVVTSTGIWDMMIALGVKTNEEFNIELKKILNIFNEKLLNYETSIVLSTTDTWMKELEDIKELKEISEKETIQIDEKDKKILALLKDDARLELTKIARQTNLSPEAVKYRINNLKKKEIIHSYSTKLNTEKLNLVWFQVQFLLKNITDEEEKKTLSKLKSIKEIAYILNLLGKWNFEVNLYCKDINVFRQTLLKIRELLGDKLKDYNTNIILKKHKGETQI